MKKIFISLKRIMSLMIIIAFSYSCNKEDSKTTSLPTPSTIQTNATVTDIDGNIYNTITIGSQVWMLENLKVTHYRNGDPIPYITSNVDWYQTSIGAYSDYGNNANNSITYGRLYNWYAVSDSRNIAPVGFHIPNNSEWQLLISNIGVDSIAGGRMKEMGLLHWQSPNSEATNSSGFTALPAGFRTSYDGNFGWLGMKGAWWTTTTGNGNYVKDCYTRYDDGDFYFGQDFKNAGFSVRCVKD